MPHPMLTDGFLTLSRENDKSVGSAHSFTLDNGTQVNVHYAGVIEFEPSQHIYETITPKSIIYSCGIHGNETAPIELCDQLVQDILHNRINVVHRLLVIFGNLRAMNAATRFIDENLNRLFCGKHSTNNSALNEERSRAALIEQSVEEFFSRDITGAQRFHYDLHTAIRGSKTEKFAVYPYTHNNPYSTEQIAFMVQCGVTTLLLSQSTTATFSYYSSQIFNAYSFTVELGKVKPFGENDLTQLAAINQQLRCLISCQLLTLTRSAKEASLYTVNQVITKHNEDFTLHFNNDILNFSEFEKGECIASEANIRYLAEQNGEAIVFPNADVPIGQRALLTVIPISIDELSVI